MNFRTINDLNALISQKIHTIPDDIDLVAGVPRSGMLPALIISLMRNCQVTDFKSLLEEKIYSCGITKKNDRWIHSVAEAKHILVVEDSSLVGNTLHETIKKIEQFPYRDKVTLLVVYVSEATKNLPDLYFESCEAPRMFEWNYLHHGSISSACFDMDGVLCRDPLPEENDDGPNYLNFIRNAELRVRPTVKLGTIVSARLEKYRHETEHWLKKNDIQYDRLELMQLSTMQERQKLGNHGQFKAEIYNSIENSSIFIESASGQAQTIARLTGKPVYCVDNQTFYQVKKITSEPISAPISSAYDPEKTYVSGPRLKSRVKARLKQIKWFYAIIQKMRS